MARRTRCSDAGYVYHMLNRAVGRATLFAKPADYAAFEKVLRQGWDRFAMRLLAYVILPNHWHLVVWPENQTGQGTFLLMLGRCRDRASSIVTVTMFCPPSFVLGALSP
jgi:putative transposase